MPRVIEVTIISEGIQCHRIIFRPDLTAVVAQAANRRLQLGLGPDSPPGVVLPLDVPLQLAGVEIDITQIARGVPPRLVVEMG